MKIDVVYNKSSQRMDELPDNSIDMILTSCPYWGLRDYGEDVKEIWGGDPNCEHNFSEYVRPAGGGHANPDKAQVGTTKKDIQRIFGAKAAFCQKCNAWYGQLGLEPTLEMYIEHLLLITLECKRVLKPTGVMWWNHGDSYFTGKGSCRNPGGGNKSWKSWNDRKGIYPRGRAAPNRMSKEHPPKCLALQNYRLVIRMIDEQGWILRNDAIWNKPNGMPSSVKDRLANKYEPVFCLVKNTKPQYYWNEKTGLMADRKPLKAEQKEGIDWHWIEDETGKRKKRTYWHSLGYWYDLDAIREPHKDIQDYQRHAPFNYRVREAKKGHTGIIGVKSTEGEMANYNRKGQRIQGQTTQGMHRKRHSGYYSEDGECLVSPKGKNPGDVWIIPTQPRPEAHFATFPDKLCIKPILASCPAEICKKCGKARVRITEITRRSYRYDRGEHSKHFGIKQDVDYDRNTIGWTDCGCNAGWDSGVLLDPFTGKGTALEMAKKLGRHYVGYELKKEYCEKLIKPALEEIDPLFNWKTPSPAAG